MSGAAEDIPARVAKLEGAVSSIDDGLKEVRGELSGIGGKIDDLVRGLTSTDGRAAERAQAVKAEIRDETDRKAKDRSELFKNGLALIGSVVLIVGAICGPYLTKLDQTAHGAEAATAAIAGVREVLAQQGAEIGRNRDASENARDKNRLQDERLLDLTQRIARAEGAAAR